MALFLEGAALGFSAAAQPGPLQAYLVAQSARNGAARTLPVAAVPLATDAPLVAVVLAALSRIPGSVLPALGIAGGALLLWLGIGALVAARRPAPQPAGRPPPTGFARAMLVNLTNPNAWLFWSLVGGPILTEAWRTSAARATVFLAGFYLLLVGGNLVVVLAAGRLARSGPNVARALGAASGVVLVVLGAWRIASAAVGG